MANPPRDPRRIVSFSPGATETLFVLGVWDRVVGVTHECDFPPAAKDLPHVTRPTLEPGLTSRQIDETVRARVRAGQTHDVDVDLLSSLRPDLVVAQPECDVCAVTPGSLEDTLKGMDPRPAVHAFHAHTFETNLEAIRKLGQAVGAADATRAEIVKQWSLTKQIRQRVAKLPKVRVAVLDWLDPVMYAGHWTLDIVEMAGGEYTLVGRGERSRAGSWEELKDYAPHAILAAPCGLPLERAADELATAVRENSLWDLEAVAQNRLYVADGNRYFNRPGPRLIYAAALLARVMHGDAVPALPPAVEASMGRIEVPRRA